MKCHISIIPLLYPRNALFNSPFKINYPKSVMVRMKNKIYFETFYVRLCAQYEISRWNYDKHNRYYSINLEYWFKLDLINFRKKGLKLKTITFASKVDFESNELSTIFHILFLKRLSFVEFTFIFSKIFRFTSFSIIL